MLLGKRGMRLVWCASLWLFSTLKLHFDEALTSVVWSSSRQRKIIQGVHEVYYCAVLVKERVIYSGFVIKRGSGFLFISQDRILFEVKRDC